MKHTWIHAANVVAILLSASLPKHKITCSRKACVAIIQVIDEDIAIDTRQFGEV